MRCLVLVGSLFVPVLTSVAQVPIAAYSVKDVGTLGGATSALTGINASTQTVGYSSLSSGVLVHAVKFANGTLSDIDPNPGDPTENSVARAINAVGDIVGSASASVHGEQPLLWYHQMAPRFLGVSGRATAINGLGQVTGIGNNHAFLYSGGTLTDLGPGLAFSQGNGINDAGQITGAMALSSTASSPYHAFFYTGGGFVDLGTLGGSSSQGMAINPSGKIAGTSLLPGDVTSHAFLYSNGAMTDLGILPGRPGSQGLAINSAGDVAGSSGSGNDARAFLYHAGSMYDLNTMIDQSLGVTLTSATGINDRGEISANGYYRSSHVAHGFVLTWAPPIVNGSSPVEIYAGTNTNLTIFGTNFVQGTSVTAMIPGVTITNVQVLSGTVITLTVNSSTLNGTGPLLNITTPGGSHALYAVVTFPFTPTVSAISSDPATPGSTVNVIIAGRYFNPGIQLVVPAGITVTNLSVPSWAQIRATFTISPSFTPQTVPIYVQNANGASNTVPFTVH